MRFNKIFLTVFSLVSSTAKIDCNVTENYIIPIGFIQTVIEFLNDNILPFDDTTIDEKNLNYAANLIFACKHFTSTAIDRLNKLISRENTEFNFVSYENSLQPIVTLNSQLIANSSSPIARIRLGEEYESAVALYNSLLEKFNSVYDRATNASAVTSIVFREESLQSDL